MLKIQYQNKEYEFPAMNPIKSNSYVYGTIDLGNNWRELDYKNGGHTLNIGAASYFEVPRKLFRELYKSEFFYSDQIVDEIEDNIISKELPLIDFDLEISFTKIFDFKTCESVLIGNIKNKFPTFKELENLALDKNIVEDSLLQFGNSFSYELILAGIRFGEIKDNTINLICLANFETPENKGKIEIDIWLPINLYFRAGVHTDDFPGKSQKEKREEIKDCFAFIYDITEYDLVDRTYNKESEQVEIQFKNKKWN